MGNRQQSRFIALVSDYDRLSELVEEAANADDAATLQTLKTMDSLESKIQNLKNAWQGFYANLGMEEVFKGALDTITAIVNRFNDMPKMFGKIPAAAIVIFANLINIAKTALTILFNWLIKKYQELEKQSADSLKKGADEGAKKATTPIQKFAEDIKNRIKKAVSSGMKEGAEQGNKTVNSETSSGTTQLQANALPVTKTFGQKLKGYIGKIFNWQEGDTIKSFLGREGKVVGSYASIAGSLLSGYAQTFGDDKAKARGATEGFSGLMQLGGAVAKLWGGDVLGAISSVTSSLSSFKLAIYDLDNAEELYIKTIKKKIEEQKKESLTTQQEAKDYKQAIDKLSQLIEHQYDSDEAYQELLEYRNSLIDTYPQLLDHYDSEGNALIKTTVLYNEYAKAILAAKKAAHDQAESEVEVAEFEESEQKKASGKIYGDARYGTANFDAGLFSTSAIKEVANFDKFLDLFTTYFVSDYSRGQGNFLDLNKILSNLPAFSEAYQSFSEEAQLKLAGDLKGVIKNTGILGSSAFPERYSYINEDSDLLEILNALQNYIYNDEEFYAQKSTDAREKEQLSTIAQNLTSYFDKRVITGAITDENFQIADKVFNSDFFANLLYHGYGSEATDTAEEIDTISDNWLEIISNIGQEGWKALTEILSHPEQYASIVDMRTALIKQFGSDFSGMDEKVLDQYLDHLAAQQDNIRQAASDKMLEIIDNISIEKIDVNTLKEQITNDEEGYLTSIQSRYYDTFSNWLGLIQNMSNSGDITSATNLSNLFTEMLPALANGGDEIQNLLFSTLVGTDFTDKTSIDSLIQLLKTSIEHSTDKKQQDQLTSILENIQYYRDNLYETLNTQIARISETMQKTIENYTTMLDKASKGFDSIADMEAIAGQFGKDWKLISDGEGQAVFEWDEVLGKYVYTTEALAQLYDKTFGKDSDYDKEYNDFITRIEQLETQQIGAIIPEDIKFSDLLEQYETLDEAIAAEAINIEDETDRKILTEFFSWAKENNISVENLDQAWLEFLTAESLRVEQIKTASETITRQKAKEQYVSALQIDKILAGEIEAVKNFNENLENYLSQYFPESSEDPNETAEFIRTLFESLNSGDLSELIGQDNGIETAAKILKDEFDRENPYDDLFEVYVRDAKKKYELLQKLASGKSGEKIHLTEEEAKLFGIDYDSLDDLIIEVDSEQYKEIVAKYGEQLQFLLDAGELTLEDVNAATFAMATKISSKFGTNAFNELAQSLTNVTSDSIQSIANAFGLNFNAGGLNLDTLEGIYFTGTEYLINDYEAFARSLFEQAGANYDAYLAAHQQDLENAEQIFLESLSKERDTIVSALDAPIEGAVKELQNLSKAQSGKFYNLTYLTHVLGESVTNVLAGALKGAGIATLENGILKINPGQNVVDVLRHITDVITAAGLDDAEIQAAVAEIQDAIVGMLDSIINLFSNGLEGKLSNADKLNLETMAAQYGFTGELTFTETAEGLKLSAESAQELAFHLQKVAGVKSQLVFDAYAKSLQETSSSYKDIFATEKTILQLTKELEAAEARKDANAIASLKQQLQLAQQIALVQMSDTDSYAFMDKKLPADFAGPTNYWDSVDKMYSSLAEASKTGYLSTEDFYNMMMAANDMAAKVMEETGEKMTFMGRELDGKALTAAQLIQEGFEHLEHVDGKGLMVSLKGFGVDFAAGAKAMGGDFEKGMKEFAKTQVKLLDGLIAFMETIVAMEQLEDIDDKDGILSFEELFPKLSDGTAYVNDELIEIIQGWQENEELWKQFEQIRFTDSNNSLKSFDKWLEDAIDNGQMAEADAKRLQIILNTLYQLQKSGDWDMTDIAGTVASMQELLSNTDFEGDIQIGNMQFTVSGGYTIAYELDEEDNPIWTVGNKEFNSWEDAIKQQKLVDFGAKLSEGTFELSENENFVATYTLEGATIKVDSSSGTPLYLDNFGGGHKTLEEALRANYQKEIVELGGGAEFEEYLSMLGLKLEGGEIKVKGEEVEESATIVKNAAESLTTATNENTTAINKLTSAIGKFVGLTPEEEAAALDTTPVDLSLGTAAIEQVIAQAKSEAEAALAEAQASFSATEAELTAKIAEIEATKEQELAAAEAEYTATIQALTEEHAADVDRLEEEYHAKVANIEAAAQDAITAAQRAADEEKAIAWADAQGKIAAAEKEFNSMLDAAKAASEAAEAEAAAAKAELEAAQAKGEADAETIVELESKLAEAEAKANAASIEEQHVENVVREGTVNGFGYLHVGDSSFESDTVDGIIADMLGYIQESVQEGVDTKSIIEGLYAKFDKDAIDSYFSEGSSLGKTLEEYIKSLQPEYQFGHLGGGLQDRIAQSSDTTAPSLAEVTEENTEAQENATKGFQNLVNLFNEHAYDIYSSGKPDAEIISSDDGLELQDILEQLIEQQLSFELGDFGSFTEYASALQEYLADVGLQFQNITMDSGAIIPQLEFCGEALQEVGIEAQSSGKKMHKGRKDIQTASASIGSALSNVASRLSSGLNEIVKQISDAANAISNTKITAPQITGGNTPDTGLGKNSATGSFGNALAAGTLMGELGPELWVSHGHYYVAGQNGAEFVNLPDDAIVFNHLQTERLLGKGKAGGHGKPVTNERKATSLATGNVHGGLAMASASDTLAQLKQLRAMWEAIAKMSVTDLAKKAGSGGGGGGGGSNDNKAFIKDLQRWFTWEQRILQYEKAITEEQKKRAVLMGDQVAHGREIYKSLRNEYNALTGVIDNAAQLSKLQFDWYNNQANKINNSKILKKIFEFDQMGQIQYRGNDKPGSGLGLDILATLNNTDIYGVATGPNGEQGEKWGAKQQVDYLVKALETDRAGLKAMLAENGNALDKNAEDTDILQAFGETVDSIMSNMNSWWDGAHEEQNKMLDAQNSQNEIIQQVIDNQLSLEQRVLTALIDQAQKAIDDLQDSRDALADANQKYIDGLNDSLQKQKDMYDRNEAANDLNKLQRQLAILQRSGGSASQIRSLQQQINDQMQDAYFTAQQDQITAIQEAADKQIERLDYQIDLMTQTLEYQKENGLLWDQVYEIMTTWDDADILAFIQENTASLQGISSLDLKQQLKDASNEIGIFKVDWAEQVGQAVATSISQSRYHEPKKMEQPKDDGKNGSSDGTTTAPASTSKGGGGGGSGGGSGGTGGGTTSISAAKETESTENENKGILRIIGKDENGKQIFSSTKKVPLRKTLTMRDYVPQRAGYGITGHSPRTMFFNSATEQVLTVFYKKIVSNNNNKSESLKGKGFASGGLVDYTGPAQVHGSKSKPESFFDAQSTAILRDDVLGSINVLDSLLADVSTAGTNSLNLGTNESLSIANPVININVDKIANDYDAKRAGQLAFDEMVKIARQSGNRSLSRR